MKSILAGVTGIMIAIALVAVVHAESALTGKWQGETPGGSQIVLDLTATDTTVKGTLTRNGEAQTIADGKVSKNTFTFNVVIDGQTEGVSGELAGDEVTVWPDRQGPARSAVLKRVKK